MTHDEGVRCIFCLQCVVGGDDAQKVSQREVAHTHYAFSVNAAFFAALDAEKLLSKVNEDD
jgi:hypothetical protein